MFTQKNSFATEMEAENWMINNCLENGFFRYEKDSPTPEKPWIVYDWDKSFPDGED